jgi:hypothetical protein
MVFRQQEALVAYEQVLALEERPDAALAENVPLSFSPSGAVSSTTRGAGACCPAAAKGGIRSTKSVLPRLRASILGTSRGG